MDRRRAPAARGARRRSPRRAAPGPRCARGGPAAAAAPRSARSPKVIPKEALDRRWRVSGSGVPSAIESSTCTSARPSPMQWWIRATMADPPWKCSTKCIDQSGRSGGSGSESRRLTIGLERGVPCPGTEPHDLQVPPEVELRVGLPGRQADAGEGGDDPAPESPEAQEPLLDELAQPGHRDGGVQHQHAGDHHEVHRIVHPEPGRVDVPERGAHRGQASRWWSPDFSSQAR